MATSGTTAFTLTMAEIIDEAFERCGVDPSALTEEHLTSARRSLGLLFKIWQNTGINQWTIEFQTHVQSVGETTFNLPAGTVDIIHATVRTNNTGSLDPLDIPIYTTSRQAYLDIPNKDLEGRMDRYWVDRQFPTPFVTYWPAGENATDEMRYYALTMIEDPGDLANNPDTPDRFLPAVCSGLAWQLAPKFAPEREGTLEASARDMLYLARSEDRERGDLNIVPNLGRRHRRGRF